MDNKYLNEWYDYWMIRYQCNKKHRPGGLSSAKTVLFFVHLQGFEPWTNRLRVYCSTNWAKGADLLCHIGDTSAIIWHRFQKVNTFFNFFYIYFFLSPHKAASASAKHFFSRRILLFSSVLSQVIRSRQRMILFFVFTKTILRFFYKYMHSLLRIFLFYLDATSLQIGFPSEQNFISYSVMTFPSAIALLCRSKVNSSTLHPASGIDSSE